MIDLYLIICCKRIKRRQKMFTIIESATNCSEKLSSLYFLPLKRVLPPYRKTPCITNCM